MPTCRTLGSGTSSSANSKGTLGLETCTEHIFYSRIILQADMMIEDKLGFEANLGSLPI